MVDSSTKNNPRKIDTGVGIIHFSAPNRLDEQFMEAIKKILEHNQTNRLKFLQHLESFTANGYR